MTDTPTPYDPSQPLRADATDEQIAARENWKFYMQERPTPDQTISEVAGTAREFASACVAAERAKIERAIRALPCWLPNLADGGRSMVTEKRGGWLHRANVIEALPERNAP